MLGLTLGLFGVGLSLFGSALLVPVKAELSVHLINHAWARTLAGEENVRPWPWMDSHPVAQISVPRLNKSQVVMSGVSGAVMAFAPGWHEGTTEPGKPGVTVISAHKDTHFDYLPKLDIGEVLVMTTQGGDEKQYVVEEVKILDTPEIQVSTEDQDNVLVLSTCYPFSNWQIGGKMRFVTIAREVPPQNVDIAGL